LLGAGSAVDGFLPAANVAKNPARHFELDPAVLIAAHRNARAGGPEIIGHYHSHPAGGAVPSARDTAMAVPDGSVWLIISATDVRAWRAVANGAGVRFQTVRLLTEARLGRMGAA
jgi:proteasome lid subunit RPN8/RPN11